jgi:L-alanine-DL-glutamate epimerase-like enolase superfamily enzyme
MATPLFSANAGRTEVVIERLDVSTYIIPTDFPEADGTLEWHKTTLLVVEARGGGISGLGYTYADTATARLIKDLLSAVVQGRGALAVQGSWIAKVHAIRNLGRPGIVSMAISAVDAALWDLKARLLNLPLVTLLGSVRESVPVYGSGGFTSYPLDQLQNQLGGWVSEGIPRGAHGSFDKRSYHFSPQLWANINRGRLALAGGGIAALVIATILRKRR